MDKDQSVSQFYNKPWYIYNGSQISGPTDFSSIIDLFKSNPNTHEYFLCQKGMPAWQKIKDTIELHELLQTSSLEEEKNRFKNTVEEQITKINSHITTPTRPQPKLHFKSTLSSSFSSRKEFDQVIKELQEEKEKIIKEV